MSYTKGATAFVDQFKKRFPEPEFIWETKVSTRENDGGTTVIGLGTPIIVHGDFSASLSDFKFRIFQELKEPIQPQYIYDEKKITRRLIVEIAVELIFGIRLRLDSCVPIDKKKGVPVEWYERFEKDHNGHEISSHQLYYWKLHRRPKNSGVFGNQHCKRLWLKNKPNFRKMGAFLSAEIARGMVK